LILPTTGIAYGDVPFQGTELRDSSGSSPIGRAAQRSPGGSESAGRRCGVSWPLADRRDGVSRALRPILASKLVSTGRLS